MTSTFLLEGLKDPSNHTAWQQFADRYRPMVVRYARRFHLSDEDAQDVAQQTLLTFYLAYRDGKYSREKGRLRQWLFGIAKHRILDALAKQQHREVSVADRTDGTGFFGRVPAADHMQEVWENEWRESILRQCLQIVRHEFDPKTLEAFELFTRQGWPARKVAEHLKMTSNAVFIAKHRVLGRIRELLPRFEDNS